MSRGTTLRPMPIRGRIFRPDGHARQHDLDPIGYEDPETIGLMLNQREFTSADKAEKEGNHEP